MEPDGLQQVAKTCHGIAPNVADCRVMSRQHPLIGRQIEDQPAARAETPIELVKSTTFVDPLVAQDIGAEDAGKRSIGKRQVVNRARTYRTSTLDGGTLTGLEVEVQSNHGFAAVTPRQSGKKSPGSATSIEDGAIEFVKLRLLRGHEEVRVHSSEPPHAVFHPVELVVLGGLHRTSYGGGCGSDDIGNRSDDLK